jgi:predicted ABC-type ATPase
VEYLPREAACPTFINLDLIAAGLSPFDPDAAAVQAGRMALAQMRRYLDSGQSFAF